MELEGWNSIPPGSVAAFEVGAAPRWLRVLFFAPFIDRFAYPLLVARGLGSLDVVDPDLFDADAARTKGWRILPQGYVAPRTWTTLRSSADSPDAHMGWKTQRRALMPQQYVVAGIAVAVLVALMIAMLIPFLLGLLAIGLIAGWVFWRRPPPPTP
ncbi:hypothetical protein [Oryzihumus leptocrescens]|uniref:Uncharacterized protein n=1 Tax=Oryzihumus leptocrescens TaxID=297536 RepID=A0A542ZEB6_9MICO|nr:hypothetical protein [Oryzihumus leptocrescens]TQL58682.1 hypothetical protein FB474_0016 [Oryzihumus leptocrescens]